MQEGSPRPLFPHLIPRWWALLTGQPPPLPHTGADVPDLLPTGAVPTGRGGHQDNVLMDGGGATPNKKIRADLEQISRVSCSPGITKVQLTPRSQRRKISQTQVHAADLRNRPRASIRTSLQLLSTGQELFLAAYLLSQRADPRLCSCVLLELALEPRSQAPGVG